MDLKICPNGHRYDSSITPECPECAKSNSIGHTVPLMNSPFNNSFNNAGNSNSFGTNDEIGKTVPIRRDTVPLNPNGFDWSNPSNFASVVPGASNVPGGSNNKPEEKYSPTMPLNFERDDIKEKFEQRIAGWLVCIDGPEMGRDFRLHEEYNYIGRSEKMDICIPSDPTISRENHAIIAYDTQDRAFYFAPLSGASIIRHNGKAVMGNVELKYGDRLKVGKGTFLFVPLCGESFQWGE